MSLPKFLQEKNLTPNVTINPDLNYLGTESAFDFGAKVLDIEKSGKFEAVYKFHVGDTGPKTPEPIIEVARQALADKQTKYGHYAGFPQVRKNIADYWNKTRGLNITEKNVVLEPGGKPTIEMSIQALMGPDDKIIVQDPGFPIYDSLANFYCHGRVLRWTAKTNPETQTLEFDINDLKKLLAENQNVKLLCVNTPQNPTGIVLTQNTLEQVAELVRQYKFFVIYDDIYDQIVFDGKEQFHFLSLPDMIDYTVNLNGLSKNYAMTGWRVGIAIGPEWLMEIFGKLAINKFSCVSRVNQIVTGAIFGPMELDGHKYEYVGDKIRDIIKNDVLEYGRKGKFVEACLRELSPYVIPNKAEGAFYLFPNFKKLLELDYVKNTLGITDDKKLAVWLLEEKGFACLAGSGFGPGAAGYLRLSYAEDREKHIIPGMKHLLKVIVELVEKSGATSPLAGTGVNAKVDELVSEYF